MKKITPFLWFAGNAEEAVNYYVSIFKNATIGAVRRYGEGGPGPAGTVMTMSFELDGQAFMALNGGPMFTFSSAISFFVDCATQEEVDDFWDKLSEGGEKMQCGWLKDKFGITWQIVPSMLGEVLSGKDPAKSRRAMGAMMKMSKLDIQELRDAYEGN